MRGIISLLSGPVELSLRRLALAGRQFLAGLRGEDLSKPSLDQMSRDRELFELRRMLDGPRTKVLCFEHTRFEDPVARDQVHRFEARFYSVPKALLEQRGEERRLCSDARLSYELLAYHKYPDVELEQAKRRLINKLLEELP